MLKLTLAAIALAFLSACSPQHSVEEVKKEHPKPVSLEAAAANQYKVTYARFDSSGDSKVSLEEYEKGLFADFDMFDTDRNGQVTQQELSREALNLIRKPQNSPSAPISTVSPDSRFGAYRPIQKVMAPFILNEGQVEKTALASVIRGQFKKEDLNSDGFLTAEDVKLNFSARVSGFRASGARSAGALQ